MATGPDALVVARTLATMFFKMTGRRRHMDTERLDQLLTDYTARLEETRPDEVYKWDAIRHFRDTFDLGAQDLAGNLKAALSKTFGKTDDNSR